jgi:hypothetical protein
VARLYHGQTVRVESFVLCIVMAIGALACEWWSRRL